MLKWIVCIAFVLIGQSVIAQQRMNSLYEPQVFEGIPCRVMRPVEFDTTNSYPVIVSLHGAGGKGANNDKQLKDWNRQLAEPQRRKDFPCYVVAPQAAELWNAEHLKKIQSLITTLPAANMDRIYIMGHSMGGHGTYIFIQLAPGYFAAAAPSAGSGLKRTGKFIDPAKIKDVPIWAFHGDKDRTCPFEKDKKVFDEMKKLGGNMKLTTWAGDSHGVSGKMIVGADNGTTQVSGDRCDKEPDFMTWLFSQQLDTRQAPKVADELEELIAELIELVDRLNGAEETAETRRSARYLKDSVKSLRKLREIRSQIAALGPDTVESKREQLQKQAAALESRSDADEELVHEIVKFFAAARVDREDMLIEIGELRSELESHHKPVYESEAKQITRPPGKLSSGEYFITQSWSQERDFQRPYHVNVPTDSEQDELPVFIFLHGNGGNAKEAMRGFTRGRKQLASRYVMVFAQGYRESWNIVSERSKADDVGFIEAIVQELAKCNNVDANNFTIMGASNGAALVNQLMIESKLSNVRNYISGVSPLNVWQHDGKNFKAKGDDNNYRTIVTPAKGKRLLNISGVSDKLVPYDGGLSKVIPAKDGKLAFVAAEESTYVWARQMGYDGERLARSSRTIENVEIFSYLDGDVVHYKVTNEGHGATHGISEDLLLAFLQRGEDAVEKQ